MSGDNKRTLSREQKSWWLPWSKTKDKIVSKTASINCKRVSYSHVHQRNISFRSKTARPFLSDDRREGTWREIVSSSKRRTPCRAGRILVRAFLSILWNAIYQIDNFSEKVVMSHFRKFDCVTVLGWVIDWLTKPTVVTLAKAVIISFHRDVRADYNLQKIVIFDYPVELHRFSFLHEHRTPF